MRKQRPPVVTAGGSDFQKRLKERRIELGLTQEELGKMMGLTKGTISRYESGSHIPIISMWESFAKVLDVDKEWLVGNKSFRRSEEIVGVRAKSVPIVKGPIENGILENRNILRYHAMGIDEPVDFGFIINDIKMRSARMSTGDVAYVSFSEQVKNGDIVAAVVNGRLEAKRYVLENDKVFFVSEGQEGPIITSEPLRVVGKIQFWEVRP